MITFATAGLMGACEGRMWLPSTAAGAVFFGAFGLAMLLQDFYVLRFAFDYVEIEEVAADPANLVSIAPTPTNGSKVFRVVLETGPPFQFDICQAGERPELPVPTRAEIFREDGERSVPLDFRFEDDQFWADSTSRRCLSSGLHLEAQIETQARICLHLHVDSGSEIRIERTCWDFVRERFEETLTLGETVFPAD